MYECIKYEVENKVAKLIFNRAEQRNAVNRTMREEIMTVLAAAANDDEVNVVVIGAAGKSFCAGRDVGEVKSNAELPLVEIYKDYKALKELTDMFYKFPKPLIAAVNGHALGLGNSIITYCDLVVAGISAKFGFPEIELNIVPGIASVNVAKVVSKRKLSELILLGNKHDAMAAMAMGMVTEVVADDQVMEKAMEWATKLANLDSVTVALSKQFVHQLNEGATYDFEAFSSLGLMSVGFANKNKR